MLDRTGRTVGYAYFVGLPLENLVRLALTALLATIPAALSATFTLSAAVAAQTLARRGVLLTHLSAAHEAAAMDILFADKTGTLTRNALEVVDVRAMPGVDRERMLALAALARSEADQDLIDAVRSAAAAGGHAGDVERLMRRKTADKEDRLRILVLPYWLGGKVRKVDTVANQPGFRGCARLMQLPEAGLGDRHPQIDLGGYGLRYAVVD